MPKNMAAQINLVSYAEVYRMELIL